MGAVPRQVVHPWGRFVLSSSVDASRYAVEGIHRRGGRAGVLDCFRVPERCFCRMCTFYPIQDVNRRVATGQFRRAGSGNLVPRARCLMGAEQSFGISPLPARVARVVPRVRVKPGRSVPCRRAADRRRQDPPCRRGARRRHPRRLPDDLRSTRDGSDDAVDRTPRNHGRSGDPLDERSSRSTSRHGVGTLPFPQARHGVSIADTTASK